MSIWMLLKLILNDSIIKYYRLYQIDSFAKDKFKEKPCWGCDDCDILCKGYWAQITFLTNNTEGRCWYLIYSDNGDNGDNGDKSDDSVVVTQGDFDFTQLLNFDIVLVICDALGMSSAYLADNAAILVVSTGHSKGMVCIKS